MINPSGWIFFARPGIGPSECKGGEMIEILKALFITHAGRERRFMGKDNIPDGDTDEMERMGARDQARS
jgi:hypothetical protein